MKISVCSDLHLEFGPISLQNDDNADVLVLSGDICVAKDVRAKDDYGIRGEHDRSNQFHTFFQECSARFPHVIYIMGNHEHYHGDFSKSLGNLRTHLGYLRNLYILDKEVKVIDDVMFIAGTLWTDMNKEDPLTLNGIRGYMNDYRIIDDSSEMVSYKKAIYKKDEEGNYIMEKIGEVNTYAVDHYEFDTRPSKFSPEKSVVEHKEMLKVIEHFVKQNPNTKTVVCGHHAPSKLSTKPQYEKDVMVNGAYSSDLSEFILDHPSIKLWTHGHTHHEFDYMIGSTRIFCNPRGYDGYEGQADNFTLKTVEI